MIQDSDTVPDVFGEWCCEKVCSGRVAARVCVRGSVSVSASVAVRNRMHEDK